MLTGYWVGQNLKRPKFKLEDVWLDEAADMSLNVFLHGFCSIAALVLHDKFGYDIVRYYDEKEAEECCADPEDVADSCFPVVHDYCVSGKHLIDCRGIVDDEIVFLDEFRDFVDYHKTAVLTEEQIERLRAELPGDIGMEFYWSLWSLFEGWVNERDDFYRVA